MSHDCQPIEVEAIDYAAILAEIEKYGFYSAYCADLAPQAEDKEALISAIKNLANKAGLQVTFNIKHTLCVFETKYQK